MDKAQFDSFIYTEQHAQRNSAGWKMRAQIVPKFDWLESAVKQ